VRANRASHVQTLGRADGNARHRNLDDEDCAFRKSHEFRATSQRWSRAISDERLHTLRFGHARFVARTRAGDSSIVFYADEQIPRFVSHTIGKTDDGLNEIAVIQRLALFAFELDRAGFSSRNQRAQIFRCHFSSPYVVRCSRKRIGLVMASTSSQ